MRVPRKVNRNIEIVSFSQFYREVRSTLGKIFHLNWIKLGLVRTLFPNPKWRFFIQIKYLFVKAEGPKVFTELK